MSGCAPGLQPQAEPDRASCSGVKARACCWRFWIAVILLVLAGGAIRSRHQGLTVVPLRAPLSSVPLTLAHWRGTDIPMEPDVLDLLRVSDYVNRVYSPDIGPEISLYVGYYASQGTGDQIHSPKNCLPGSGWQPVRSMVTELALGSRKVPANLYVVEQNGERQVVLYWYQSGGRVLASEYWAKFYMIADAMRWNRTDGALVRVVVPVQAGESLARQQAVQFAEALLPPLSGILPKPYGR